MIFIIYQESFTIIANIVLSLKSIYLADYVFKE